jgi:hypothetical protein
MWGHGAGVGALVVATRRATESAWLCRCLGPDFKAQIAHGTDLLVECVPVVLRLRLVAAMVRGPSNGMAGHR